MPPSARIRPPIVALLAIVTPSVVLGQAEVRRLSVPTNSPSVAAIGDVDGDGFDDVVVGSPDFGFVGAAYVLSGWTGATITEVGGGVSTSRFGNDVDGVGDVDGDGSLDFVVGDPFDDRLGPLTGAAYVFSATDGRLIHELLSPAVDAFFGISVSGVGDLNSDGFDDLLVGSSQLANGDTSRAGRVFAYSGASGSVLFEHAGDEEFGAFGIAVEGIGDVTGDGVPDLAVGASAQDPNGLSSGAVRLYSGATGGFWLKIDGRDEFDNFGVSLGAAGDLDRDGRGDVLVGAVGGEYVQALSGRDGRVLHTFESADDVDLGRDVASAGDLDDDGVPDIVVGAPSTGLRDGAVYAYSGASGGLLFSMQSDVGGAGQGYGLAPVGDVNADGLADFAVGSLSEGTVRVLTYPYLCEDVWDMTSCPPCGPKRPRWGRFGKRDRLLFDSHEELFIVCTTSDEYALYYVDPGLTTQAVAKCPFLGACNIVRFCHRSDGSARPGRLVRTHWTSKDYWTNDASPNPWTGQVTGDVFLDWADSIFEPLTGDLVRTASQFDYAVAPPIGREYCTLPPPPAAPEGALADLFELVPPNWPTPADARPVCPAPSADGDPEAMTLDLRPRCDLDGDGDCDATDVGLLDAAEGSCRGEPGFLEAADDDRSGCIDGVDRFHLMSDGDADDVFDLVDNCPADADPLQTDADADGWGDVCDCAPLVAETYPGAPEILDGLDNQCPGEGGHGLVDDLTRVARFDGTELAWPEQVGASAYEVARASDPGLTQGCETTALSGPSHEDPDLPPPGGVFYYVVRASGPIAGSWGADSDGGERDGCGASPRGAIRRR